jgi:hypothetical protein
MASGSGKELEKAVLGQFAAEGTSTAESLCKAAFASYKCVVARGLDAAAASNVALTCDDSTGVGLRITGVKFIPGAALTSDNTSYVSVQLVYNNGNGGSDTIVATANSTNTGATLGTGDWVANVGEALTITDANASIPSGSQVQVKFLKYGSGVNVPAGTAVVKGTWE